MAPQGEKISCAKAENAFSVPKVVSSKFIYTPASGCAFFYVRHLLRFCSPSFVAGVSFVASEWHRLGMVQSVCKHSVNKVITYS